MSAFAASSVVRGADLPYASTVAPPGPIRARPSAPRGFPTPRRGRSATALGPLGPADVSDRLALTYRLTGIPVALLFAVAAVTAEYSVGWAAWVIGSCVLTGIVMATVVGRTASISTPLEIGVVVSISGATAVLGFTVLPSASGAIASTGLLALALISAARGSRPGMMWSVPVGLVLGTLILVLRSGFPVGAITAYVGIFVLTLVTVIRLRSAMVAAELRARQAAQTDQLTGLGNRMQLPQDFRRLVDEALTRRERVGLLLVDVDHFKMVNDTLGHLVGDEVLRRLGDLLLATKRPADLTVRYGGEEFLVAAVVDSEEQITAVAERIRAAVQQLDTTPPVTVSVGVTARDPRQVDPTADLLLTMIGDADRALYEAKSSGRNRLVLARG